MNNKIFKDVAEAQTACARWQRILNLRDWNVKVEIVKGENISDSRAIGGLNHFDHHRAAWIRLPRPEDVEPGIFGDDDDQEVTLVHELLHIFPCLRSSDDPSLSQRNLEIEQLIETVSRSMVALDRHGRGSEYLEFYRKDNEATCIN